ncbi:MULTISPECIES: hypothetical protein [Nocardia]|uniref:MOSC domain-containing protein n=1 Tax=Nocardia elegans TaxID=300029 RepID=A0ABW6T9Q1_9NOCA|nr:MULTISPECIES: hypothetical protein [Nocardia]MBF6447061.1 hypothetical protein [Nocardia elegans]
MAGFDDQFDVSASRSVLVRGGESVVGRRLSDPVRLQKHRQLRGVVDRDSATHAASIVGQLVEGTDESPDFRVRISQCSGGPFAGREVEAFTYGHLLVGPDDAEFRIGQAMDFRVVDTPAPNCPNILHHAGIRYGMPLRGGLVPEVRIRMEGLAFDRQFAVRSQIR